MSSFRDQLLNRAYNRVYTPGLVLGVNSYNRHNSESDRETLYDYSGNHRDIKLYNFDYKGMSGYEGFPEDFTDTKYSSITSTSSSTRTETKVTSTLSLNDAWIFGVNSVQYLLQPCWLKISGIDKSKISEDNHLFFYYVDPDNNASRIQSSIYEDGIYRYPGSLSLLDYKGESPQNAGLYFSGTYTSDQPIVVELLPEYPGGLISNGLNEYGECLQNFTLPTDYTILAIRKIIEPSNAGLSSKGGIQSPFIFEAGELANHCSAWSYGSSTTVNRNLEDLFTYQTKESYNGQPITAGSIQDSEANKLYIFKQDADSNATIKAVLWDLRIYDHSLTSEELELVKDEMISNYQYATGSDYFRPKPLIHWDFSRYKDSDMTESVNYVEDLTGNGYDLRLNGFDFSIKSGFEGYAQDFNKVDGSELISKSRNIVKLIRDSDGYNVSIDKDGYNNTTYIVKVTLPEGVSELWCSCYIGDSYADYGLSADKENQTLVNGINIIQPFSEEYFNNCKYIAFFALSYTDKPCVVEQFPLNPFSLVFNNTNAISKKNVLLPVQKGFTLICNRKLVDTNIRSVLFSKYLNVAEYSVNDHILIDYKPDVDSPYVVYNYGTIKDIANVIPSDGIMWVSKDSYNGVKELTAGDLDGSNPTPVSFGIYGITAPDYATERGNSSFAISEAWLFNKVLTKEQVERFIAENATPLPQVYYDVEKQGTLDSDTNKDKIIDFSGNNNHGTLNNFTYDSYYTDEVNSLKLHDNNKGDSIFENKILTISNNVEGWLLSPDSETITEQYTVQSFKIKVTGLQSGQNIQFRKVEEGDNQIRVYTISSDGIYTIPKYTVNAGTNVFKLVLSCTTLNGVTVEFLENSNGWGDYDDITDTFVTFNAGVYTKPVLTLDKTNPEYGVAHTLLRSLQQTVSADNTVVRSPEIKMLVHRIEGGRISVGYIKNDVRGEGEFISIDTPGIYTVPSYPVTVNTTDNYYGFCVTDSGCTELEVEFLPSNVEPSYITDTLSILTNQAGDSGQVSGHSVTYTASIDKEQYLIGIIRIKESGLKGTIKLKSYGGLGDIILAKPPMQDPIRIGNFADNDIVEINITQDLIDKGYNFIMFRTTSAVTAGDKFTVELLPDLNSYIQFDAGKYTHISLDTLTEGFKTVFLVCQNNDKETGALYDQRLVDAVPPENSAFNITTGVFDVAYSYRNGGITYINGVLNETIASNVLTDKRLITVVNDDVSDTLSRNGVIGQGSIDGSGNSSLKLYKFLGFKEVLSPEQIQKVIDRYGLMEGTDKMDTQ